MTRKRAVLVAVLAAAVLGAVAAAGAWASTSTRAGRSGGMMAPGSGMMAGATGGGMMGSGGMMGGTGMMGDTGMMAGWSGVAGNGKRVESLDAARARAQVLADRPGLRVGEVMQFSNGFYAELMRDGRGATEVLVDPADGSVGVEFGPAMMWNTEYGMHNGAVVGSARVSAAEATAIAQRWLDRERAGLTVGDPEQFPGYYTLHTLRDGKIVGMMSVNAYTGSVWYHAWHGQFIAMSEG